MHILLLSTHLCFSIKGFAFIFYGYQHIFVVRSKDFPLLNVYFLIQLCLFLCLWEWVLMMEGIYMCSRVRGLVVRSISIFLPYLVLLIFFLSENSLPCCIIVSPLYQTKSTFLLTGQNLPIVGSLDIFTT